jgi:predicted GNAT family acetyltransferase
MTQKRYASPGDFLRDNESFLTRYEISAQLNRGNAQAHREASCSPELLFGRYEQEGRTVLIFGNTAPWNLCLNAPEGMEALSAQAAAELADWLKEQRVPIAGVSGRDWLCQRFMEAYGGRFVQRSAMDIMMLTRLIEPPAAPGVVRPAEEKDLEVLVRWVCAFYQEALHEEADPETVRQRNQERVRKGEIRVLESPQGELLSMAHTSRETERGISVSGVYTPPEHRGKGCCQATVGSLCRELLAGGKDYCTLFVDRRNPISNRVYRKIGFEVLEDSSEYKLVNEE